MKSKLFKINKFNIMYAWDLKDCGAGNSTHRCFD